ncbi:probable E3 SUMO-protein ligase RNF212 [Clupea harengus]|uniref:Probable E3 SUMO-protein ligase RNF212 n=1 Tax=Clupea harengus TaxID=7950 RepID=A0A8M1KW53_CLUHA|nr:probable E3 SUMO-protein ligase RNF212 [Clupea harengus]XP_042566734.1 probable E3 SUMO-protein ligase RNF212 [Clupea harengus]
MATSWICCNNCFATPSANSKLALSTCGHVICSRCFLKGNVKEGECRICKAKCQLLLISDKSTPEVKALFSDLGSKVTAYVSETSKVLLFQARHRTRLLTHYQQRNEKLEDVLLKMKQEIQELNTKMSQQNTYIFKLENSIHQSAKSASQSAWSLQPAKSVSSISQIPFPSPVSRMSVSGNADADTMPRFCKPEVPGSIQRLSLISPPQDGRIGTVPHRVSNQAARSPSVSRDFSSSLNLRIPREASWETPVFKPPFRYSSMSSLR